MGKLIIAKDCIYSMNLPQTNNNALVIGGSGSGKTTCIVTPNLDEMDGSYVVSDPKGNLYNRFKKKFKQNGYEVKQIDLVHPFESIHYNPFYYIRNTEDILRISHAIVYQDQNDHSTKDPFWDETAVLALNSIIGYMFERKDTDMYKFSIPQLIAFLTTLKKGDSSMASKRYIIDETNDDVEAGSFEELIKRHENEHPDSWAVRQFKAFHVAPEKTFNTIVISCFSKLSHLDTLGVQKMMETDEVDIRGIGKRKTAVFVTVSDCDRSMDVLGTLFFEQCITELCRYADEQPDSKLPIDVRFILDDFATNVRLPEIPRYISSVRSRGISLMLIIQSFSQLKQYYGADSGTVISNCDTISYLGSNDLETASEIAQRCDLPKQRILYMPIGEAWVFRRGQRPKKTTTIYPKEYISEKKQQLLESDSFQINQL